MTSAVIPEEFAQRHCPSCGKPLTLNQCSDSRAICLVCTNDHRFYVLPDAPLAAESAKAGLMQLPQLKSAPPEAIASYWLSDPAARFILNEQLADLLRTILDAHVAPCDPEFSFCPFCGLAFAEFEQPDIWVRGLACSDGHVFSTRGNKLATTVDGKRLTFHSEHSFAAMKALITGWLKPDPRLEAQLHESIRFVLLSSRFCRPDVSSV